MAKPHRSVFLRHETTSVARNKLGRNQRLAKASEYERRGNLGRPSHASIDRTIRSARSFSRNPTIDCKGVLLDVECPDSPRLQAATRFVA